MCVEAETHTHTHTHHTHTLEFVGAKWQDLKVVDALGLFQFPTDWPRRAPALPIQGNEKRANDPWPRSGCQSISRRARLQHVTHTHRSAPEGGLAIAFVQSALSRHSDFAKRKQVLQYQMGGEFQGTKLNRWTDSQTPTGRTWSIARLCWADHPRTSLFFKGWGRLLVSCDNYVIEQEHFRPVGGSVVALITFPERESSTRRETSWRAELHLTETGSLVTCAKQSNPALGKFAGSVAVCRRIKNEDLGHCHCTLQQVHVHSNFEVPLPCSWPQIGALESHSQAKPSYEKYKTKLPALNPNSARETLCVHFGQTEKNIASSARL